MPGISTQKLTQVAKSSSISSNLPDSDNLLQTTQIVSKMKLGMSDLALPSFVPLLQVAVFCHILDSDCRRVCAAKLVILSRGLSGEV